MLTYASSFVVCTIILSCFYKKESYKNRFFIVLYSALISLVPLTIANWKAKNTVERETIVVKSWPLIADRYLKFKMPGDTLFRSTPLYFAVNARDNELKFRTAEHGARTKEINKIVVHYIKTLDCANLPRYVVTAARVKSSSRSLWVSAIGIPHKDRVMHLYLPNDTNKVILNKAINELKKENIN
jgi:hypothetical protein